MLFTVEQFVFPAILLIAGFLLGFISRPSTRSLKRRLTAQSNSFTAYHDDAEDRIRAAHQRAKALEAEAAALRADHVDAERTIAALRAAAPSPVAAPEKVAHDDAPLAMTPLPSVGTPAPIGPAEPEMPAKGWFGGSARDDLTRMRGIDGPLDTRLFGLGVLRFEDLEKLSAEDEMALEERLAVPVGFVAREQWRTQAALLRAGKDDEHAARFGVVAGA